MSAITNIIVRKKNESTVTILVSSFRDDSLPNTKLPETEIAKTGFVLFVNSLSQENHLHKLLKEALQEKIRGSFLNLYFSKATTSSFIKNAKLSYLKPNSDFKISDIELNSTQISSLYSYMKYDAENGDYELNDDFYIEIFKNGDRGKQVQEILGIEKYQIIEPRIEFEIEFINPSYIENFNEIETESTLDSYIFDWLTKEL